MLVFFQIAGQPEIPRKSSGNTE